MVKCVWCGEQLIYVVGKGWLHKRTNSEVMMRCDDCGYQGKLNEKCPRCKSKNYVEDHFALTETGEGE